MGFEDLFVGEEAHAVAVVVHDVFWEEGAVVFAWVNRKSTEVEFVEGALFFWDLVLFEGGEGGGFR